MIHKPMLKIQLEVQKDVDLFLEASLMDFKAVEALEEVYENDVIVVENLLEEVKHINNNHFYYNEGVFAIKIRSMLRGEVIVVNIVLVFEVLILVDILVHFMLI